MKNLNVRLAITAIFVCLFLISTASAQSAKNATATTGTRKTIEVAKFDIKEKVDFPPAALDVMMAETIDELKKLNKFADVTSAGEKTVTASGTGETTTAAQSSPTDASTSAPMADIKLSGTVVQYKPGNRAARYLVGFGAGATKVVVHIKFVETATGKVLLEKNMDGKVIIGLFGGDSNGATRGLAKEVAKNAKKIP